uniref:Soluble interferon alpha/beta receptor OPG204 n=1 Tax=Ciona intestinalis TaxID=7719 RepID=H2Y3F9_CIOIN|nr:uncharacterized protein LOC100175989 [Ciona intestinalis]|eukprot:XP_002125507.1 uncharacterized protein LOC100175989 [Ciona intestinalis]
MKMRMIALYAFLCCVLDTISYVLGEPGYGVSQNCSSEGDKEIEVHIGWPFTLSCSEGSMSELYDGEDQTYVQCIIIDRSKKLVVLNETYNSDEDGYFDYDSMPEYAVGDVKDNSSTNYSIVLQLADNQCWMVNVHLVLTESPNATCEESSRTTQHASTRMAHGQSSHFTCVVPQSTAPKIYTNNITTKWLRNCGDKLPNTTVAIGHGIRIGGWDYADAGVYTCAVTYNQMTRYAVHYTACVKPPKNFGKTTLVCSHNIIKVTLGSDAEVECEARGGLEGVGDIHFTSSWRKEEVGGENNIVCRDYGRGARPRSRSQIMIDKIDCEMKITKPQCFHQPPTREQEADALNRKIKMKLVIKNLSPSDYGTYTAEIRSSRGTANATIVVEKNHIPIVTTRAVIIGAIFGVLVLIVLVCGLVYGFRRYRGKHYLATAKCMHCRMLSI